MLRQTKKSQIFFKMFENIERNPTRGHRNNISKLICILLVVYMAGYKEAHAQQEETLKLLTEFLSQGYDRRLTPTSGGNPTTVEYEIFVRSFGTPDPLTMKFSAELYLHQEWTDLRLQQINMTSPIYINDPTIIKAIWKPEVFFPNAGQADFIFVTIPNVLIRIEPNGRVSYMLRLLATFSCIMDFARFPIDTQICTMEISTFTRTTKELILQWKPTNPITTEEVTMGQFKLVKTVPAECRQKFAVGSGGYSCIKAEFHLSRLLGFYVVQSFVPTFLMVLISCLAFWMDVREVSGRVTLGITTLLTVSSEANHVGESVQSSYVKAIDIWMGACMGSPIP